MELGVHKHVFQSLSNSLKDASYRWSKYVTLEEQLTIFLYTSVTGLSMCHVAEHFQWAPETISKYVSVNMLSPYHLFFCVRYFLKMLIFFSSDPFYNDHVKLL